jgi:hypothetical protein
MHRMDIDDDLDRALATRMAESNHYHGGDFYERHRIERRQLARYAMVEDLREAEADGRLPYPLKAGWDDLMSLDELLSLHGQLYPKPVVTTIDDGGYQFMSESGIPSLMPHHLVARTLAAQLDDDHPAQARMSELAAKGDLTSDERDEIDSHRDLLDEAEPEAPDYDEDSGLNGLDNELSGQPELNHPQGSQNSSGLRQPRSRESDGGRGYLRTQGIPTVGDSLEPMPTREGDEVPWETALATVGIPTKAA